MADENAPEETQAEGGDNGEGQKYLDCCRANCAIIVAALMCLACFCSFHQAAVTPWGDDVAASFGLGGIAFLFYAFLAITLAMPAIELKIQNLIVDDCVTRCNKPINKI